MYGQWLTSGLTFALRVIRAGGDGHRICYKQPDAFFYKYSVPPHIFPSAVPLGPLIAFPRRQASGEMSHFIVALPSHRTFYRKLPKETAWHFCRNCENWPQAAYEERDNHYPPHEFCRRCIQKHRDERCEWANVELSQARFYRGTGDY